MSNNRETVLRPGTRWLDLELKGVWDYRDLLVLLVRRDIVARYKQTVLGPLWYVIQPLLLTVVFTVIFGTVAGLSTDGLPAVLFYMCGQLGWNYFAQTLSVNSSTLLSNAGLFGKAYFPRLIVPLAALISNLLAFAIQFATFLVVLAYYMLNSPGAFGPDQRVVLLPLLLLQTAALSFGVGLVLSTATAKYRDLTHMTTLLLQVWMYATPVIYPLSEFPQRWRWAAALNPMTPIVESYRLLLLGTGTVEVAHVAWSVGCAACLVVAGVMMFSAAARTFVDIA